MQKSKYCLIGGSPSSGSTYLADLLDSTTYSICGPELGLFATDKFYRKSWKNYNYIKPNITPSPHSSGIQLYKKFLCSYGLDKERLFEMMSTSIDQEDFFFNFSNRFIEFRNKIHTQIFFEKTPQNIYKIDKYFEVISGGFFIIILRNPVDVILSLTKRGYSFYTSIMTWLVAMAAYKKYFNNDRLFTIKYESLLENPFGETSKILKLLIDKEINQKEIEECYKKNTYRKVCESRISSWTKGYKGKNKKEIDCEFLENVKPKLKGFKISRTYCDIFNLPDISFTEALELSGYDKTFDSNNDNYKLVNEPKRVTKNRFGPFYNEHKLLYAKQFRKSYLSLLRSPSDFISPLSSRKK